MKSFANILAEIALLPISGCIFPGNRDFSDEPVPSSATLSGRSKPVRTAERKKALKPRLGEIGLKG